MRDPVGNFAKTFQRWGDLYTIKNPAFGREVVVSHPELVRQIFTGDPDVYHGGEPNALLAPVIGRASVLLLDGRAHHRERKLLVPPFHGERLAVYAEAIRAITNRILDAFPVGETFSLLPEMQRLTFDVILTTVFGVSEGEAIDRLLLSLSLPRDPPQPPSRLVRPPS
jgi:cytochrome P450